MRKKTYSPKLERMQLTGKQFIAFLFFTVLLHTASVYAQSSSLITNITSTTGRSYTLGELIAGVTIYTDRTYQATSVPAFLNNAPFIKTPNDDKANNTASMLSFDLTQSATLYVAYDPRVTVLPAWLSGWQKLADTLQHHLLFGYSAALIKKSTWKNLISQVLDFQVGPPGFEPGTT